MWRRARINMSRWNIRRFSSAIRRGRYRLEDEGDWYYSQEWWGTESDGHTVFRSDSSKGNGVVTVVAYPCSRPIAYDILEIIRVANNGEMASTKI
ncbi:hypothetical protein CKAN_01513800 [Cinnamomum micranthum f. kanehirae]|uniref:Uncharacterized protein n=1 Tax=Cinnamomum micranthum f. kanehirae TaxID=337451 RepID=A0A443P652_9MAGN|nr:hypothetical protein CKAN_01513800 [Cinnamomum micranthum f. kanehirae]